MHMMGIGVQMDPAEGFRLWKVAADQGYTNAQYQVGNCYARGTGVDKDQDQARRMCVNN